MKAARTHHPLRRGAAPLLAKRGATKEQRREDFLHLRTHWLESAAIAPAQPAAAMPEKYKLREKHNKIVRRMPKECTEAVKMVMT